MAFTKPKVSKKVRLQGTLEITIQTEDGPQTFPVSSDFLVATDLTYSGMSIGEQETTISAVTAALSGKAEVTFTATMQAQELKSAQESAKVNPLDDILAGLTSASPADRLEAVVREDQAVTKSKNAALDILGASSVPTAINWSKPFDPSH